MAPLWKGTTMTNVMFELDKRAAVWGRVGSAVVCAGMVAALGCSAAMGVPTALADTDAGSAGSASTVSASSSLGASPGAAGASGASGTAAEKNGYSKEQVVYVKAAADGTTQGVYVVNGITANRTGKVVDEGKYSQVTNLSDEQKLESKSSGVTFEAQKGETFYYQGDLSESTELPWDISVAYYLDGKEVAADTLGGKTGDLKMVLSITPVEAGEDADETEERLASYADAYLLQVSASFDGDCVSDLVADGATRAISGDNTQLTYMVFPGKSAEYTVEVHVEDFSFDGWQIAGVPLAMSIDVDSSDLSGNMSDVDELKDAIGQVDDGAGDLADGAGDLKDGANQLVDGVGDVSDGVSQLSDGTSQLVSSGSDLTSGSADVADGIDQLRDVAQQLNDALAGVSDPGDGSVTSMQTAAKTLSIGLATLSTKYDTLDQGINDYTAGVGQLADGVSSLQDGVSQLSDGASSLADGAGDLADGANELADGTGELREQTADIDNKIADGVRDGLTDYLNPDFTPADFVNGDTDHITRVQFVIKTDGISVPDEGDAEPEEAADEGEQTFIDKLVALFK